MAVSGYQPWVAHNREVIKNALKLFVAEKKAELVDKLRDVAKVVVDYVDKGFMPQTLYGGGTGQFPIWTANLRDATGVGLYVDGRTEYFMPTKLALRKQSTGPSMGSRRNINGSEFLRLSITEGAAKFNNGIWIVLYSAVPYASEIDAYGSKWGRGKDYFKMTKAEFTREILSRLKAINPMFGFNV